MMFGSQKICAIIIMWFAQRRRLAIIIIIIIPVRDMRRHLRRRHDHRLSPGLLRKGREPVPRRQQRLQPCLDQLHILQFNVSSLEEEDPKGFDSPGQSGQGGAPETQLLDELQAALVERLLAVEVGQVVVRVADLNHQRRDERQPHADILTQPLTTDNPNTNYSNRISEQLIS